MSHVYPALLEAEPEGGFSVTFPEIGFGATYGASWEEARRQAEDMLEEAVLGLIAHGEEPAPQSDAVAEDATRRALIALPALTAAKLELYRPMREAGLDEAQFAQRLECRTALVVHQHKVDDAGIVGNGHAHDNRQQQFRFTGTFRPGG